MKSKNFIFKIKSYSVNLLNFVIKTNKYKKLFFLICLFLSLNLSKHLKTVEIGEAVAVRAGQGFEGATPIQSFQIIGRVHIVAWSQPTLIGKKLKPEEMERWNQLIDAAVEFFKRETEASPMHPRLFTYKDYLHKLKKLSSLADERNSELYAQFGSAYEIDPNTGEVTIKLERKLTANQINKLKSIENELQKNSKSAYEISREVLEFMGSSTPPPKGWSERLYTYTKKFKVIKKKVLVNEDTILKDWENFLKDYKSSNQNNFEAFLEKYKINDIKRAEDLINKLEKIAYIQDKKKFHENSRLCHTLIRRLRIAHPGITTELESQKLYETRDKISTITIGLSFSLGQIFDALLKDIKKLRAASDSPQ